MGWQYDTDYIHDIDQMIDNGLLQLGKNIIIGEDVKFTKIDSKDNTIIIGDNCTLRSGCIIYGGCRFGDGVSIGHNSVIMEKTIIGENTYLGALINCEGHTTIGANCGINAQSHLTKFTTIGDYTFFGPMVCTTNDWDMRYKRSGHGKHLVGPNIGKGVRVGNMATILPGITLGDNCIVGAGSIVTKDVNENDIVYGVPARVNGLVKEEDRL
jgi:acetyltransferase-like isoleucine patch superfamily enzyme